MGRRRHGGRAIGPRLSRVTKAAGARPPAGAGGELTGAFVRARSRRRAGERARAGRGAGPGVRACARARARKRPLPHRGGGGRASPGDRPGGGGGGAGVPARGRPRRAATPPRSPGKGGRGGALRERGERAGGRGRPGRPGPGGPRTHAPDRGGERPLRESPPHRQLTAGGRGAGDHHRGTGKRYALAGGAAPSQEPEGRGEAGAGWRRGRRGHREGGGGGGGGAEGDRTPPRSPPLPVSSSPPPPPAGNPHAHDGHTPPTRPARTGPGPGSEGASPGDTTGRGGPVATPNAARPVRGPRPGAACARPAGRGGVDRRRRGRRCGGGPRHAHPPGPGAHRRESSRVRRWARTPAHRWRHGTGAGGRRHTTARGPSAGRTPGPTAPGARREGRTHTRTHRRARPRRQAAGPAKTLPRLAGGRRGPRQAKGGARPHRGAGGPLSPHRAGRRGGSACEPRSVACAQDEGRRLGDPAPEGAPGMGGGGPAVLVSTSGGVKAQWASAAGNGACRLVLTAALPHPGTRVLPAPCCVHPPLGFSASSRLAGARLRRARGASRRGPRSRAARGGEEVRQSLTTDRRGPAAATQPGPPPRKGDFPRHRRKQHAGPPLLPLSLASRGSRHLRDGLERSRGTAKGPLEAHRHHLGGARGCVGPEGPPAAGAGEGPTRGRTPGPRAEAVLLGLRTPPPPTLAARPRTRADERGRAGFRAPAPLRTTGGRGGGARGPRAEREERSHSPRMSVPRLGAARTRPGRARQHHIDRVSAGTSEEEKTPRQGCQEAGEDSPGEDPLSASPAPPGLRKGGREDPAHGERLTREARGPGGGGAGHTLASTAATAGACDKGHAGQRARGARATPPSCTGDRGEAPRLDTWTRESRRTGPRRAAQAGRSGGGRGPSVDQRLRTRPGFPSAQRESPGEESVSAPIWWPKSSVLGERKATPRGGRGPLPTASPRNCGPAIGP
ncbi:collagen alpha-1(I) chain-like [Elephas maximus indicus]|uniref:collagen alpha-1(I) chain-like n=1 Tax=Elephas maximus indicus TaxID=99487 RepID=UPI0021165870|nr:collagen alpha-1(I) chain-like [Elephas maximus indicus]